MNGVDLIGFDGDDTLWHNETLFVDAQARLKEILARYTPKSDIDAHLYDVEIRNLKLFGYGVKGFALSMIEAAVSLTDGRISGRDVHRIVEIAKEMLESPVELLENVRQTLEILAEDRRLVLITKGDLVHQRFKVENSGLMDLFKAVEIVPEKDEACYRDILARQGVAPERFVMVGNSLKSDVLPAVALGARGVHVPYHVTWAHEAVAHSGDGYWTLDDMSGLPALLAAWERA